MIASGYRLPDDHFPGTATIQSPLNLRLSRVLIPPYVPSFSSIGSLTPKAQSLASFISQVFVGSDFPGIWEQYSAFEIIPWDDTLVIKQ